MQQFPDSLTSKRLQKTLYISQPIIFNSKILNHSDQVIENKNSEPLKPSRFSHETQQKVLRENGLGDETKQFFDISEKRKQLDKQLKVLRPQQIIDPRMTQAMSMGSIFDEVNNEERKKYIDCAGGPRYDPNDKVIKWSVVGYQQFQKMDVEKRKQQPNKLKGGTENSFIDDQPGTRTNLQTQTIIMDPRQLQQARKTPKKNRGDQKPLDKRILNEKMKLAQTRITTNQQELETLEQKLPLHLRNAVLREERAMKTFETTQTTWDNVNIQVAANCFRKPEETIMIRSDQYRERNQMIQALEQCKGEDEKNNSRYWYLRLRWYDHKDQRPPFSLLTQSVKAARKPKFENRLVNRFVSDVDAERLYQQPQFVLSDIQSNFNAKLIDNPFKQVETVVSEQSKEQYNLGNLERSNEQISPKCKLYSSRLENLYSSKIKEKPKKKYIETKDFMSLTGESQFRREQNMLKKCQGDQFQIVDIPQEEQEVLTSNWDFKNLAKSGEHPLI